MPSGGSRERSAPPSITRPIAWTSGSPPRARTLPLGRRRQAGRRCRWSPSRADGVPRLPGEVEVGVPVGAVVDGDDLVQAGVLASGRYATIRYTGHPDGLLGATAYLLERLADQ